jgi:hypothetical protein
MTTLSEWVGLLGDVLGVIAALGFLWAVVKIYHSLVLVSSRALTVVVGAELWREYRKAWGKLSLLGMLLLTCHLSVIAVSPMTTPLTAIAAATSGIALCASLFGYWMSNRFMIATKKP